MPANLQVTVCITDSIHHVIQHANVVSQCTLLNRQAGARAEFRVRIHVLLASWPGSMSHSLYLGRLGSSWRSCSKPGHRRSHWVDQTRVFTTYISWAGCGALSILCWWCTLRVWLFRRDGTSCTLSCGPSCPSFSHRGNVLNHTKGIQKGSALGFLVLQYQPQSISCNWGCPFVLSCAGTCWAECDLCGSVWRG